MNKQSTRQAVIETLRTAQTSLDAYEVAKHTGLTPIQAGRTLRKLASENVAVADDEDDGADELEARYRIQ